MHFLRMKFLATIIAICSVYTLTAQEKTSGLMWYTDVKEVYSISHKLHKPVFAFFTGSDWCGWCKRLQAAVFSKPEFATWAKQNVVLLELDFPRHKQLPPQQAQQNNELQNFFKVGGFPTVWIFDMQQDEKTQRMNISAFGSLGYPKSDPGKEAEAFLATANQILKNKK